MTEYPLLLIGFALVVIILLAFDLGVFNRVAHSIGNKEALVWSLVWISLSMLFSVIVYRVMGFEKFTQFQSAYWIEKSLSVDNLFVFILIFKFFKVPHEAHHKVLFWGIAGALAFRALFIFSGVWLINITYLPDFTLLGIAFKEINIILALFGGFLIYAGIKSWFVSEDDDNETDFNKSAGARIVRKVFHVSSNFEGAKFFTWENGKRLATPLLVVVGVIEITDVLFAVDSIPAIFAISKDPFILYTSNIFAILGLRALYFLLANFMRYFSRLKYGLAVILTFIGTKMIIAPFYHISSPVSLAVVGGVLLLAILASILLPQKEAIKG